MKHYDNIAIGCKLIDDIDNIINSDLFKIQFKRQIIGLVK